MSSRKPLPTVQNWRVTVLSPDEFRAEYLDDGLAEELPDRPISSLRDVQYLYGTLYTLATAGGGKYAAYLTPDAAGDLIDEPDSLVVVRVDLSGEEPQLADGERGPVWVTRYSTDRVERVSHCKYPAARGIDHSVTHQAGRNSDPGKLARYAKERLSKWAHDDVIASVAAEHDEGWILDALAELGDDEDVLDTVEAATLRNLSGSTTALLTVQVKLEPNGEYRWPGDVDVFNAAMRARKLSKLVSKGQATDAAGEATDLVTGERTRTVGTAEDPLNYFLGKQLEKFPGMNPDEAWRTHPISEDAAITLMNAETFVDACTYRTFGARVYCLPYLFGRPTAEEACWLYRLLHGVVEGESDDDRLTPIERAYQALAADTLDENRLRFYVGAIMPHQMSRYDVFGETMNALVQYPAELARTHNDVLQTATFRDDEEWTGAFPTADGWSLLSDTDHLGAVASGWYFAQTFPEGDDDTDASADDPRIEALVAVLSGDSIPVSSLLNAYADRIIDDSGDDEYGFPSLLIASQYAQLCALASADHEFLHAQSAKQRPITTPPTYETRSMSSESRTTAADGGYAPAEKLESFVENTPALADDERRASFLLGALVGAVGNYQEYSEGRSTTLVDQFPVKSITRTRIKKVTQDTIGKTLTYTRQEKKEGSSYPGTKFDYIVDELRDSVIQTDPETWDIETADLRFYYALGITYGMNDRPTSSPEQANEPEATSD